MIKQLLLYGARRQFSRRYIPVLMAGMFFAGGSLCSTMVLVMTTYLRFAPVEQVGSPLAIVLFVLAVAIVLSNYLIARGRPRWLWVMIAVAVSCFAIAVPALALRPDPLLYGLAVVCPWLCLLTLNTSRHRRFREHCLAFRHERERAVQETQAQKVREQKRETLRARRHAVHQKTP